jgi:two-component system, OmpR family, phosphate regulon sensor histidine kinase PhoR
MTLKKPGTLFYHVLIFIVAQIIWFSLLSLWIYWYVTNYLLLSKVEDKLALQMTSGTTNIVALISGLVLLVLLSLSMSIIFIYLNRQLNVTRLYDNFIANVTHELKSPLSSIQLYLETMQKREVPPDKKMEFLSLMLKDIDRLNQLINSILYLSSLEQRKLTRKVSHDYHIFDTDTIIREVIEESQQEFNFPGKNITIEGNVACQCVIDRNWLKIVFNNLIDNAIKYSPQLPQIKIQLNPGKRYFYIEFSDNGIGISQKDQKKIFNKFHRIYNPESPNVKGTGLGLYWVREIVEYHGGKISVSSAGKNLGSTFKISLPIYQESKKRYMNRLLRLSRKYQNIPETENGQ